MKQKKRVLVGMSGGVDSSVTAALLKKRGYEVIGMTMQLLPKEEIRKSACCNLGAVSDAKRVCQKLGIPHYTINSRDNFQEHVINDFISKYANGLTPNPCVECNRYIKFDEIWEKGKHLNADFVATGHYCQITKNHRTNEYFLKKGKDPKKDQSYFLYMLTQEKLKHILFPLGGYKKIEIRQIAESLNLINANKPDSQEICFVSSKSYKDYVNTHIPKDKKISGKIVDLEGTILGQHNGIYQFTIGQRKGLNLGHPTPLYVIKICPITHTITVGKKGDIQTKELTLTQFTCINQKDIINKKVTIKTRYQMAPIVAIITHHQSETATLLLQTPELFAAPGQSCVLYDHERVVGGGVIAI